MLSLSIPMTPIHMGNPGGKPVNLAGNCSKHILAELKHAHVEDVEKYTCGSSKCETVDRVAPPPWTSSLLAPVLSELQDGPTVNTGDDDSDSCNGELGMIEDADPNAESPPLPTCLSRISQQVHQLNVAENRKPQVSAAEHCVDAVRRVANTSGDNQVHFRQKKRPRGSTAFFAHMAATQATMGPKHESESVPQWRKRVAEKAKETWATIDTLLSLHFVVDDSLYQSF